MTYLQVANWDRYQHYKDRQPPWIKLHRTLLRDHTFNTLGEVTQWQLVRIWILASECDNRLAWDERWIRRAIGTTKKIDLDALITAGFLVVSGEEKSKAKWPSRYVSPALRLEVLTRDERTCVVCSSQTNLELDHIVPVSKGGKGVLDNLQTLCRPCNRRKRSRVAPAEQFATQNGDLRSLETETETEKTNLKAVDLSVEEGGVVAETERPVYSEQAQVKSIVDARFGRPAA